MSIQVLDKDGNPQTIMTAADVIAALQTIFGNTGLDYGPGTGGTRTQRFALDTAQFGAPGPQVAAQSTSVVPSQDVPFSVVDGGSGLATVWGVAGVPVNNADMTTGTLVTDAPTTGQKIVIDDILISVGADMNVTLKEETSGTILFGPWYCSAKSGPIQLTLRGKKKLAVANKKVQAFASAAGGITVQLGYHSEA